ncbi:hypothetical protein SKAU_G00083480 [Synaphobranchus kaupii]|uniref:Uncharacterized protein n=1 Tax=Synaphobranchus kaupii TaxID=118154 RepID=A0A9Q1FW50_SYNKA|nr:hypothetical protein SKAU_G00083480 [Synaphobranchus kaupii]
MRLTAQLCSDLSKLPTGPLNCLSENRLAGKLGCKKNEFCSSRARFASTHGIVLAAHPGGVHHAPLRKPRRSGGMDLRHDISWSQLRLQLHVGGHLTAYPGPEE